MESRRLGKSGLYVSAIAWLLAQGKDMVPIPGTKRRDRLEENAKSLEVALTRKDLDRIDEVLPPGEASGMRYGEEAMRAVNR
jgi:aryl-alcohol dehydrogenase-like predicted oxidoreductase